MTKEKQRRLRLDAAAWLADAGYDEPVCRFDVFEIYLAREGSKIMRIEHLQDAF